MNKKRVVEQIESFLTEKKDGRDDNLDNFGDKKAANFDKEDGERASKAKKGNKPAKKKGGTDNFGGKQAAPFDKEDGKKKKKDEGSKMNKKRVVEQVESFLSESGVVEKDSWPNSDKSDKGRFTEYCKRAGFDGPGIACAKEAMASEDASVRGMASMYMNTVKPNGKDASDVAKGT